MSTDITEEEEQGPSQGASADDGSEDQACDYCTETKQKATKSCLQCLVSYCEQHLQDHYKVPALQKHKLIKACRLQDVICSKHHELERMFCHTDHKCICSTCAIEEHIGHKVVSAAEEMKKRKAEVEVIRPRIKQKIIDAEESVKVLQQEVEAINTSAEHAVKRTKEIGTKLVQIIEKTTSDVTQKITLQQEYEVKRAKDLKEKQEKKITELQRTDAQLEKISKVTNESMYFKNYPSLSEPKDLAAVKAQPLRYFRDVTSAVSEVGKKLLGIYRKESENILNRVTEVDVVLPQDPETSAEFSIFLRLFTLDPNTANKRLLLSDDKREVTSVQHLQSYSDDPGRFMDKCQVLGREGLTGRCYWEVKWSGLGVIVAAAYKDISRTGEESGFGNNDKSWALELSQRCGFTFKHDSEKISLTGPMSFTIGVFLAHNAGTLSFYSISETTTLLHRVQTTFTQPLYPGLCVHYYGVKATVASPTGQTDVV